jgi:hypothetical protein
VFESRQGRIFFYFRIYEGLLRFKVGVDLFPFSKAPFTPLLPHLPCLLPFPLPSSFLCHDRDTRVLFSVLSFHFLLPFCGSTKRVRPFVLPQKGRTVPSLFLLFLSTDSRGKTASKLASSASRGTVGFQHFGGFSAFGIWLQGWGWAEEVPEFLAIVLAKGFLGGVWVYYEFRRQPWDLGLLRISTTSLPRCTFWVSGISGLLGFPFFLFLAP